MLFNPEFLACPTCNPKMENHWSSYGRGGFKLVSNGVFACVHGHQFTLYDSVSRLMHGGVFGIIQAFAHHHWSTSLSFTPGEFIQLPLPTLTNFRPFVASAAPAYAHAHTQQTFLTDTHVGISTSTIKSSNETKFDGQPQLMVTVWFYSTTEDGGWNELLYESLSDYLHHRYHLAIFKLASSAEVWADALFEKYLINNGKLANKVTEGILREQRSSWRVKFNRIRDLASVFLDKDPQERFAKSREPFDTFVRTPRNDFAHRGSLVTRKHEDATDAYVAALDVLWTMDHLANKIQ
jgi:hypothetical protein